MFSENELVRSRTRVAPVSAMLPRSRLSFFRKREREREREREKESRRIERPQRALFSFRGNACGRGGARNGNNRNCVHGGGCTPLARVIRAPMIKSSGRCDYDDADSFSGSERSRLWTNASGLLAIDENSRYPLPPHISLIDLLS